MAAKGWIVQEMSYRLLIMCQSVYREWTDFHICQSSQKSVGISRQHVNIDCIQTSEGNGTRWLCAVVLRRR